jgi:hypothetical protein
MILEPFKTSLGNYESNTSISINNNIVVTGDTNDRIHLYSIENDIHKTNNVSTDGFYGYSVSLHNNILLLGDNNERIYAYNVSLSETDITLSDHLAQQPILDISQNNNAGFVVTNYDGKFVTMRRTGNYIYYLSSLEAVAYKRSDRFRQDPEIFIIGAQADNFAQALSLYENKLLFTVWGERSYVGLLRNVDDIQYETRSDVLTNYVELVGYDIPSNEGLGFSGCVYDDYAVVGWYIENNLSKSNKISIYRTNDNWQTVISSNTYTKSGGISFGYSLSLSKTALVVGDPGKNEVYVYNITQILDDSDLDFPLETYTPNTQTTNFGISVSVDQQYVAIRSSNDAYYGLAPAQTVGDPYIKPMFGTMYKLPDLDACYRILESKSTKVNAQVQKVDQDYINARTQEVSYTLFNNDVNEDVHNWENMYFFTEICIHYKGEIAIVNLLKGTLVNDCPLWLEFRTNWKPTENSFMYKNEDVLKIVELRISNVLIIETALYSNPQILTGIKVKSCRETMDGLLMYKYRSESAQVDDLYDTSECNFEKPDINCNVSENFYTNNGKKETRCIDVV